MKYVFLNFVKGVLYGIFSIVPGLSGGVLASRFGDYEKIVKIINKPLLIANNIKYLCSIVFGILFGMFFMSKMILFLYNRFHTTFFLLVMLFNFLIVTKIHLKQGFKLSTFITTVLIISLIIFCYDFVGNDISFNSKFIELLVTSLIFSISKILPGVSSTSILINIGFYEKIIIFYSNPIKSIYFMPFFWIIFWILFFIYSVFLLKIVNKMIEHDSFNYFIYFITIFNSILMFWSSLKSSI